MAKKPKEPNTGGKKGISWTGLTIFAVGIGLVFVAMPTVILLIFGLLPTFASLLTDKSYHKSASFCIGALNFAGLFPYLFDLWGGANTIGIAVEMIANVFSLFIIYGAAGFGLLLFNSIPPMIGAFLTVVNEKRMKVLRKTQQNLIEEWGEAVAETGLFDKESAEKEKAKSKEPATPAATPQATKTNA